MKINQAESSKQEQARRVTSLGRVSLLVMLALLLSKLTGQLRQILVGLSFGYTSAFADGFTQGFLIPDFVYTLLIGGAIQSTIVPYLSGSIEQDREEEGWRAVSSFLTAMALLMAGVLLVCELLAPQIMRPFASEASYPIAVRAARALLPQAFFMMLAALLIGILQTYKKFISTALTPCLYNLLLLGSLLLWGEPDADAVVRTSIGITAGAAIYFLVQLYLTRKEIRHFRPRLGLRDPEVLGLFRLAIPTLVSSSLPYLSSFLISSYYRYFPNGTSYAYSNAVSTWQIPFGIIVIALTNVLLPHLSQAFARRDYREAGRLFSGSLRSALLLILPAALGFYILRDEVIQGIFQWSSAMSPAAIQSTADILQFYCIVLVGHTLTYFLNAIYFANRVTWVPMLASVVHLVLLFGFSRLFVFGLELGPPSMAAAFACATFCATALLLIFLRLLFPQVHFPPFGRFVLANLCSLVVSGGLLYAWESYTGSWQPAAKLWQLAYLALRALLFILVYLAVAKLWRLPEVEDWLRRLHLSRRSPAVSVSKAEVAASEAEPGLAEAKVLSSLPPQERVEGNGYAEADDTSKGGTL